MYCLIKIVVPWVKDIKLAPCVSCNKPTYTATCVSEANDKVHAQDASLASNGWQLAHERIISHKCKRYSTFIWIFYDARNSNRPCADVLFG